MKRIASLAMTLVLALSLLAGCGSDTSTETEVYLRRWRRSDRGGTRDHAPGLDRGV